jgi:L,D-transpeptidase YbiS
MKRIVIDIGSQSLALFDGARELKRYTVSTSKFGPGEKNGSHCTPRGRHVVRAKIGAGQPIGTVFVRRRPTGEVWTPELHAQFPGRDWILTRVLWLSGREPGSPDSAEMGKPGSIGCIRMRNADIAELFELVPPYTEVEINA